MFAFWVAAGVLSAVAAGLILHRASAAASRPEPADPALGLYRRQLSELDDLTERGLLPPSEHETAKAEAGRRLLRAADRKAAPWIVDPGARKAALAIAAVAPALAMGVYLAVGSPGVPDQPFAERMKAWRVADPATLSPPEMAAVIEDLARARPRDPEAQRYLGLARAAAGDASGAVSALRKAVALAPGRADLWESLGEAATMQAEGKVTPQAEVAFNEALKRDPKSMASRFHLAAARVDAGDKAGGVAAWRALLADLPPDDPRRETVLGAIAQAEGAPPPAPVRQAMPLDAIRGMVEGLATRLQASPDDADGWVRLVRSYAVLGDAAKRDAALKAARARFAGKPDILRALDAAAATEALK